MRCPKLPRLAAIQSGIRPCASFLDESPILMLLFESLQSLTIGVSMISLYPAGLHRARTHARHRQVSFQTTTRCADFYKRWPAQRAVQRQVVTCVMVDNVGLKGEKKKIQCTFIVCVVITPPFLLGRVLRCHSIC